MLYKVEFLCRKNKLGDLARNVYKTMTLLTKLPAAVAAAMDGRAKG